MGLDLRNGWFVDHSPGRGKIMSAGLVGIPGKYYFEVTATTTWDEGALALGIGTINFNLTNPGEFDQAPGTTDYGPVDMYAFSTTQGVNFFGFPGPGASSPILHSAFNQGDVLGVAVDTIDGLWWIRDVTVSASTWYGATGGGTPDPVTLTQGIPFVTGCTMGGGNIYVVVGCGHDSTLGSGHAVGTINFGATSFGSAAPTGYTAWDASGNSVLNPLDKASAITLSGGNLTWTATSISGINQPTAFVRSITSKAQ